MGNGSVPCEYRPIRGPKMYAEANAALPPVNDYGNAVWAAFESREDSYLI